MSQRNLASRTDNRNWKKTEKVKKTDMLLTRFKQRSGDAALSDAVVK